MFQLARTYKKPAQGSGPQRGFPSPGEGMQTTGPFDPAPEVVPWDSSRPTKGRPSLFQTRNSGQQAGQPAPTNAEQARPRGSMPNLVPQSGAPIPVWTPYYSRGAAAYVQNFGKVLANPIGAGVVANHRPQASYGPAAQYFDSTIWWTSQAIPTSVNLQGLTGPEVLAAVLGQVNVQGALRVA